MIKNIFIFSIIIFMYSCSSTEYSPDDQLRFNSTWENFLSKTKSANTEARKTHWSQKANAHLDQKLSFQIGMVKL